MALLTMALLPMALLTIGLAEDGYSLPMALLTTGLAEDGLFHGRPLLLLVTLQHLLELQPRKVLMDKRQDNRPLHFESSLLEHPRPWLGAQWLGLTLGVPSRPEPPGALSGGTGGELGHRQVLPRG